MYNSQALYLTSLFYKFNEEDRQTSKLYTLKIKNKKIKNKMLNPLNKLNYKSIDNVFNFSYKKSDFFLLYF